MARTRKSLPENLRIVIDDLTFVLKMVKMGRVNNDRIEDMTRCIWRMREEAPVTNTEEELVRRYNETKEAQDDATTAMAAYFWPLVKTCTTEKEARELMGRVPGNAVEKVFMWDYFVHTSKLIPVPERKS